MATPVSTAFNETNSARLPAASSSAHTPVIVQMQDEKDDVVVPSVKFKLKHKHTFVISSLLLVALIVGCTIGFTVEGHAPKGSSQPSREESTESQEGTSSTITSVTTTSAPAPTNSSSSNSSIPQLGKLDLSETTTSFTTTEPPTTPPPTTTLLPKLKYTDTNFQWLNIDSWQGDNDIPATFAQGGFRYDRIQVSTFGREFQHSPVLRTKQGWAGEKVVLIEWIVYAGSDPNIWMLPTTLKSQFGDPSWPNCGEYDIFEMFNGDAAIGHTGTNNQFYDGGLNGFGQSTMHMASLSCFAPYYSRLPNLGPQAAQWKVDFNTRIKMAVVFGTDDNGQYIQQIRDPKLTFGRDSTMDIQVGDGIAAEKIYNNARLYWGVPPSGACAAGHNPATGYPYWNPFRLVLQEQFQGVFDVTNIQIFTKTV